jgi:hypothetical protein
LSVLHARSSSMEACADAQAELPEVLRYARDRVEDAIKLVVKTR